jgi:subtilisin family serine protease
MAAPHTAGAAALLAAAHPGLTGAQLKDLLVSTSKLLGNTDVFQVGSGRVDVPAALSATVFATATAFAGGPTDGSGSAVQRPVTHTKTGDAPVTLALTVEASAPAWNAVTHMAVLLADPTHKLTVRIKDAKGNPTRGIAYLFKSGMDAAMTIYVDDTGVAEVWVPGTAP